MSKAFTSEDSTTPAVLGRSAERPDDGEPRYVTAEGYEAMRDELTRLTSIERPRLASSESIDRVAKLAELDHRIGLLADTLGQLTVVQTPETADGRAVFGTWVDVEDESGARLSYRLVGADEADARRGWINVRSPVGRALVGKREGDTVVVRRPNGETELSVLGVRYSPRLT